MADLGTTQKEAWAAMLVAHSTITRKIDRILAAENLLSLQVYDVMLALEEAPDQRLRMGELADQVVFDPSSLTRLIDRLAKQGLVCREAHPNDKRSIFCCITPKGLEARERTWPRYRELLQEHFGKHISEGCAAKIRDGLMKAAGPNIRLSKINNSPKA